MLVSESTPLLNSKKKKRGNITHLEKAVFIAWLVFTVQQTMCELQHEETEYII